MTMTINRLAATFAVGATLVVAAVLPRVAAAGPATSARARIERALSAVERIPNKKELALLVGDALAEKTVQAIVARPSGNVLAKSRALTVLRYYPSKTTRALLRKEIAVTAKAKRGLALVFLGQALRSYAAVAKASAAKVLRAQLGHPSVDVRVAAAEALRLSTWKGARAALAAHQKRETSKTVRAEIKRQLALLDAARDRKK